MQRHQVQLHSLMSGFNEVKLEAAGGFVRICSLRGGNWVRDWTPSDTLRPKEKEWMFSEKGPVIQFFKGNIKVKLILPVFSSNYICLQPVSELHQK